ncbi:GntR family transcriptional regulator [Streptomyces sp. NBC_01637]|uniref:GntR family transcriptional regulator n=1 Tax=unclassified Streptomyces TaxID=2593676 RepID=UPI00386B497B|nr:GntR family transcriptional regulator [Streptomyces sp. NBC_01653]WTD87479.1 GntR family transcriptional regulator [Streptomyces sp. NBC_01637]
MRPKSTAERAEVSDLLLSVDRSSPVPLYYQLSQQLEQAIEQGRLRPGSLLGNEIDLAAGLGLSRPTVRQAIQALVDKGLMVRRRGVGTLVVHSQVKRPLELSSLYDDLESAGQRPATRVLVVCATAADAEVATALGVAEGEPVTRVERLRLAHGEPLAVLRNHIPADVAGLSAEQLAKTGLYRLMGAAGTAPHSARQTIGARSATAEEGLLLHEPEGAPLLTMRRVAYDTTGRAVEYANHYYRASRYSFELQLLIRS